MRVCKQQVFSPLCKTTRETHHGLSRAWPWGIVLVSCRFVKRRLCRRISSHVHRPSSGALLATLRDDESLCEALVAELLVCDCALHMRQW